MEQPSFILTLNIIRIQKHSTQTNETVKSSLKNKMVICKIMVTKFVTRPPAGCSCCSPAVAQDAPTPRNATAEPVVLLSARAGWCSCVETALMKMLVGREWLGSAHPEPLWHSEQLPCLCSGNAPPQLRSAAPGPRRRKGII